MEQPTVSLADRDGTAVVTVRGRTTVEACKQLQQRLLQANISGNVVVEWEQAEHVHASLLQILLALQAMIAPRGFSLSVGKDSRQVRNYLEMAGLAGRFPVQPAAPASEARNG